jgi:hypothetical protein
MGEIIYTSCVVGTFFAFGRAVLFSFGLTIFRAER